MRYILAATAAITLAGCHAATSGDDNNAAEPNEASVEAVFANEQVVLDNEIADDASADESNAATDDAVTTHYSCDNSMTVDAAYDPGGRSVELTVNGKVLTLSSVVAASGSKYHSDAGLVPGMSLTWWTKGDSAMLIQAPSAAIAARNTSVPAHCLETDAPGQ
jgi:membrane-bound inhibitor of C-type lysozyme